MKKLICADDITAMAKRGEKTLYVDRSTLITPSAADAAGAAGIEISYAPKPAATACANSRDCGGIDSEIIYNALQALAARGLLNDILNGIECLTARDANVPYRAERDTSGLKIIKVAE